MSDRSKTKSLTKEKRQLILADYDNIHLPIKIIAYNHNVSIGCIANIVRRSNHQSRRKQTEKKRIKALADYLAGLPLKDIASRNNVSDNYASNLAKYSGFKLRNKGRPSRNGIKRDWLLVCSIRPGIEI